MGDDDSILLQRPIGLPYGPVQIVREARFTLHHRSVRKVSSDLFEVLPELVHANHQEDVLGFGELASLLGVLTQVVSVTMVQLPPRSVLEVLGHVVPRDVLPDFVHVDYLQ